MSVLSNTRIAILSSAESGLYSFSISGPISEGGSSAFDGQLLATFKKLRVESFKKLFYSNFLEINA